MLTISTFRRNIRYAARTAGDPTEYPTVLIDTAGRRAANMLIRDAHLCLRTDSQDTQAYSTVYAAYAATHPTYSADVVAAYAAGVNAGLAALGARPPEYFALRERPAPWCEEDTVLVALAMYNGTSSGF